MRILFKLANYLAIAGIICLTVIALDVLLMIGLRIPGKYILGTQELTQLLLLGVMMLPLAWTQLKRRHIRVEILTNRLSATWNYILNIVGNLDGIFIFSLFVWQVGRSTVIAYHTKEYLMYGVSYPAWPAKMLVVLGCSFLCVQLLLDSVVEIRSWLLDKNKV